MIAATSLPSLVFGLGSSVFVIRLELRSITLQDQSPKPKTNTLTFGCCQFLECAKRVLPRHLLAPVHDEVGVVERASFYVSSFSGSLNVIAIEWLTD